MSELPIAKPEAHRRQHARLRLGIPARLESLDGSEPVRLIDLSQSGAHVAVTHAHDLRRGVLCWLGFEAFGFVAWRDGEHLGIEFEELVPMEQLFETRQRAPDVVRAETIGDYSAAREFVAGTLHQGSER